MDNTHIKMDIANIKNKIKELEMWKERNERHFAIYKSSIQRVLNYDLSAVLGSSEHLKDSFKGLKICINELNDINKDLRYYQKELEDQEWELEKREADNE